MPQTDLASAQYAFAAAIRAPNSAPLPAGVSRERLDIYHELFFNNFRSSLESAFPVLYEVLEPALWERLLVTFFRDHQCATPEFPRMPQEFLHWLEQRKRPEEGEPPFLRELALWEWTELEVLLDGSAPPADIEPQSDLLQGRVVLTPTLRLHAFYYPVHRIAPGMLPEAPLAEPLYLAAYRNRLDETAFLELNGISAALLSQLIESPARSGRQQVEALCHVAGWDDNDTLLGFATDFLNQLRHLGVVLGATITDTMERTS